MTTLQDLPPATEPPSLGIIGVGGLAEFFIAGLRRSGDRRRVILSPRNAERSAALAPRYDAVVARSNQAVADAADLVVVATPPAMLLDCVRQVHWRSGQRLLSVAIDVPRAAIQQAAPGATVLRAMPSSAAAIGCGATPLYPPDSGGRELLSRLGPVYELEDEDAFDAATALAAFYLWTFGLMDAVARRAVAAGLPSEAAHGLTTALTQGAASVALGQPDQPIRTPLDSFGTPGSITAQGLKVLDDAAAFAPWQAAYDAVLRRLRERAGRAVRRT